MRIKFSLAAVLLAAVVAANTWSAEPAKDATKPDEKTTVLVTKSGTKYHVEGCPSAKDGTAMLLSEAKGKYEPCSICHPDATVYVTKSGNKFHMKDCPHAKEAVAMTLAEAKFKKLEACKTCNPPEGKKKDEKKSDDKKDEKKDDGKKDEKKDDGKMEK